MKKDVCTSILNVVLFLGIIAAVFRLIMAISQADMAAGFASFGVIIGCVFLYWIVSTATKICEKLENIKQNTNVIRQYCEQKMLSNDGDDE